MSKAPFLSLLFHDREVEHGMGRQPIGTGRVCPRQARSRASVDAILVEFCRREMTRVSDEMAVAMASREEGVAPREG